MQPQQVIPILFAEVAVGTFLGLIAKVVVSAVSTAGAALGNFLGLIGGHSNLHEDQEATTAIGDLLILTATVQIVSGDIYGELLGGLAKTYEFLPLGGLAWNTVVSAMQTLAATISATFLLALVLVAPFLVLAVFINATLGLANRMIPQLPVQFIGGPLLVCSGLLLTEQGLNAFNETFVSTISQWLSRL